MEFRGWEGLKKKMIGRRRKQINLFAHGLDDFVAQDV
jgi:hypothetical protein